MNALLKAADVLDRVPRALGKLAGWLILPLIAIIMFDVITRKIDTFRIGLSELTWYWLIEPIKLQDMQWHLHGVLLLMSFGFAYLMNAHVRVDIFREKLSRRGQAWVEFWGLLVMAMPYLMLVTYFAIIFVKISFAQGEGSESLTGITHRYIVKSFTVVGFGLALSAVVATFIRLGVFLFGPPGLRARAGGDLHIFAHEEEEQLEDEARAVVGDAGVAPKESKERS
ncbi:MAG: TRAP transporter small permease subunit [Kiloniellales bacterium]|nr:TRAP transporter small permease subunit [Kiloniellales bacterium]